MRVGVCGSIGADPRICTGRRGQQPARTRKNHYSKTLAESRLQRSKHVLRPAGRGVIITSPAAKTTTVTMAAQRGFVPPQKLDGSHRCVPCAPVDETPDFEELGCNLPPLPKPNLPVMRSEACCGICVVVGIVAICVTATTSAASSLPVGIGGPLIALVLCEAFVALGCLGYLMWGDPGVVRRTRATCLPVPPEVLEKLAGIEHPQPLAGMRNIQDRGRTYCVRCCLWRDAPPGHLPRSRGDSQLDALDGFPDAGAGGLFGFGGGGAVQRCIGIFDPIGFEQSDGGAAGVAAGDSLAGLHHLGAHCGIERLQQLFASDTEQLQPPTLFGVAQRTDTAAAAKARASPDAHSVARGERRALRAAVATAAPPSARLAGPTTPHPYACGHGDPARPCRPWPRTIRSMAGCPATTNGSKSTVPWWLTCSTAPSTPSACCR